MPSDKYLLQIAVAIQNDKELSALTRRMEQAAKQAPRTQRAVKTATTGTANFGRVAQNTSYQLQDFIVQVQGGVDPMRALGQQLPQMLVGFSGIGVAIAGVTAAALPAIVQLFSDAGSEAGDLTDNLGELEGAAGSIGRTMQQLDLSGWVEEFNKAGEAQRQFMQETLEYDRILAERARRKAVDSIGFEQVSSFGDDPGNSISGGVSQTLRRNKAAAAALGLSVDKYKELAPLYQQIIDSRGADDEAVKALRSGLLEYNATLDTNNEALNQQIDLTWKLIGANQALATSANPLGGGGIDDGGGLGGGGASGGGQLEDVTVLAQRAKSLGEIMVEINDYNAMMDEYRDGPPWTGWGKAAEEEFSLMGHAMDLASSNMDTMFNGILMGTRDAGDAFKDMAKVIIAQLLKLASYQLIAKSFSGTAFGDAAASLIPSARGNVFDSGSLVPFARGGVVTRPTVFPMARGAGLMGEAGLEAVVPLTRTKNGDLGVQAAPMNVVVNNMAAGVSVNPRQTDQGLTIDVVLDAVAADLQRGGGPVSQSMERAYGVGRGRGLY